MSVYDFGPFCRSGWRAAVWDWTDIRGQAWRRLWTWAPGRPAGRRPGTWLSPQGGLKIPEWPLTSFYQPPLPCSKGPASHRETGHTPGLLSRACRESEFKCETRKENKSIVFFLLIIFMACFFFFTGNEHVKHESAALRFNVLVLAFRRISHERLFRLNLISRNQLEWYSCANFAPPFSIPEVSLHCFFFFCCYNPDLNAFLWMDRPLPPHPPVSCLPLFAALLPNPSS